MQSIPSQSAARANIRRALELRNKSSFDVSVTLGKNRTYLDDFLRDRKQSISGHFTTQLARLLNVHESYIKGHDNLPNEVEEIVEPEGRTDNTKIVDSQLKDVSKLIEEGKKIYGRGLFNNRKDPTDQLEGLYFIRDALLERKERASKYDLDLPSPRQENLEWVFPDAYMRDQLKVTAKEMAVFSVHDTSMARENGIGFHVGDQIIISKKSFDLRLGGLFLINSDQSFFVRQVELLAENTSLRIRCRAYNSDYPTFDLEIGAGVRVLGKAVAAIKML